MTDRTELTSTETATMSARPIISAAAVALVRLGLRIGLPGARGPVLPGSGVSGSPTAAASGRAISGPSTVAPRRQARAPAPVITAEAPANSPAITSAIPAAVTARPAARRPGEKPVGAGTAPRRACTGATPGARQARGTAAPTGITRPAPNDPAAPAGGPPTPPGR